MCQNGAVDCISALIQIRAFHAAFWDRQGKNLGCIVVVEGNPPSVPKTVVDGFRREHAAG